MSDGIAELKAKRAERATRTAPQPRHPRTDRIPASENPGPEASGEAAVSASGKAHAEQGRAAALSASENPAPTKRVPASEKAPTVSRRGAPIGRPRGPERVALSTRITRELDDLLIIEIRESGDQPQDIVERALGEYFAKQQRKRERERKGTHAAS